MQLSAWTVFRVEYFFFYLKSYRICIGLIMIYQELQLRDIHVGFHKNGLTSSTDTVRCVFENIIVHIYVESEKSDPQIVFVTISITLV